MAKKEFKPSAAPMARPTLSSTHGVAPSDTSSRPGKSARKAKDAIVISSRETIAAMKQAGKIRPTPDDAPTIELDDQFWQSAEFVEKAAKRKTSIHLRIDAETLAFFRAEGRGHLTRMANILKAYAQAAQVSRS